MYIFIYISKLFWEIKSKSITSRLNCTSLYRLILPSLDPCGPIHKYLYLVRSGGACSERDMNNVEARWRWWSRNQNLSAYSQPAQPILSFSRKAFLVNFRFYVAARCAILWRKTFKAWRKRDMANGRLVASRSGQNMRIDKHQLFCQEELQKSL